MSSDSAAAQTIVVEYDLPRPPDKVWRVLTDPALLSSWLMKNDICAVVGHKFTFQAQPMPGWDGVVQCEVLEVELHRRLRYSWRGGPEQKEAFRLDTVVTWTLSETATGRTLLRLEHSGFTAKNSFAFENMGKGWRSKLAKQIEEAVAKLD